MACVLITAIYAYRGRYRKQRYVVPAIAGSSNIIPLQHRSPKPPGGTRMQGLFRFIDSSSSRSLMLTLASRLQCRFVFQCFAQQERQASCSSALRRSRIAFLGELEGGFNHCTANAARSGSPVQAQAFITTLQTASKHENIHRGRALGSPATFFRNVARTNRSLRITSIGYHCGKGHRAECRYFAVLFDGDWWALFSAHRMPKGTE